MKVPFKQHRATWSPNFFLVRFFEGIIALACAIQFSARAAGPNFSIDTLSAWNVGNGVTGFSDSPDGVNRTMGETFVINEGNAQVTSINFVLYDYYSGGLSHFQVGVAAWGGSHPTGSFLYLSDPINSAGVGWQSFTVTPNNLQLAQGQQYVLLFTPNALADGNNSQVDGGFVSDGVYPDGHYVGLAGLNFGLSDLFNNDWFGFSGDLALQINYVIPEPTSAVLLGVGGLVLLQRRRWFKKAV